MPVFKSAMTDPALPAIYRLISIFSSGTPALDDMDQLFVVWTRKIGEMSNAECQRLADAGDLEKMHEFALRVAAGVGLPVPDIARAEQYWEGILESPRASTGDKATAHAHLVWCTTARFGCTRLSDCLKAGRHAEMAAQLGLGTAPSVISFGMKLLDARYGEHKEEFGKWTHFWATMDARAAKRQAELDKEDAKPSRYKCAASGCPVEASKGNMLRACAGKCEDAYNPRYCTKECQVAVNTFFLRVFAYNATSTDDAPKDWKSHKSMCKPGLKVPESGTPAPAARSSMGFCGILERMPGIPGESAPKPPKEKTKRGPEYSVPVEGGHIIRVARADLSARSQGARKGFYQEVVQALEHVHVAMDSSNNFLLACWKTGI